MLARQEGSAGLRSSNWKALVIVQGGCTIPIVRPRSLHGTTRYIHPTPFRRRGEAMRPSCSARSARTCPSGPHCVWVLKPRNMTRLEWARTRAQATGARRGACSGWPLSRPPNNSRNCLKSFATLLVANLIHCTPVCISFLRRTMAPETCGARVPITRAARANPCHGGEGRKMLHLLKFKGTDKTWHSTSVMQFKTINGVQGAGRKQAVASRQGHPIPGSCSAMPSGR